MVFKVKDMHVILKVGHIHSILGQGHDMTFKVKDIIVVSLNLLSYWSLFSVYFNFEFWSVDLISFRIQAKLYL